MKTRATGPSGAPLTVLQVLRRVRETLAPPHAWRPDVNLRCAPGSIAGAVYEVAPYEGIDSVGVEALRLLTECAGVPADGYLTQWENHWGRTQAQVLALLDRAIGQATSRRAYA